MNPESLTVMAQHMLHMRDFMQRRIREIVQARRALKGGAIYRFVHGAALDVQIAKARAEFRRFGLRPADEPN